MYFPYLRGRQYELLALRELISKQLIGKSVTPVVEPVKLSPTLITTMSAFIEKGCKISIIHNPLVGTLLADIENIQEGTKEADNKAEFFSMYDDQLIIKSLIMQDNATELLAAWERRGYEKKEMLVINTDRDFLDLYEYEFGKTYPQFSLIPDESAFRRKTRIGKVLLDDKFEKEERNADYKDNDDFFSDDHLFYKDDGYKGFADYSVVGEQYMESGFAPYAVAIHIVYFDDRKVLRIRHFVSDSNEDISNPAKKFYEAVSKLANWYRSGTPPTELTLGLKTLLDHYDAQTYPNLGVVKKLSIMHHLELMEKYLNEVE